MSSRRRRRSPLWRHRWRRSPLRWRRSAWLCGSLRARRWLTSFSRHKSSTGLHGACPTSLPLVAGWRRRPSLLGCLSTIDTSNCTGRLMFNMLGAIAQFERELMLERQREGIAKAKAEGKYRGRAPTARAKASDIRRLRSEGIGPTEIAKRLGISRASVYRVLNLSVMGPLRDPLGGIKFRAGG
jgi:Resolvase, N terminal domain/Helix-turn-helix domain of resolvase